MELGSHEGLQDGQAVGCVDGIDVGTAGMVLLGFEDTGIIELG